MTVRVERLTPPGRGAVAVLAVEGPGALAAVTRLAGREPRPGRPTLVRLVHDGREIEEALLLRRTGGAPGGPLVDGERIEVHLHGAPAVVEQVAAALGGERRPAVADGGLEARAHRHLTRAASEPAARILLDQAEGALRRELEAIAARARAGASGAGEARDRIAALVRSGRSLKHVITPPRVVLAGPVNAGKSTLFNLLVGRRRVVTSAEEGTTRDAIVERAVLGELAVDLIDTAGERPAPRDAAGALEVRGQARARALRRSADLVLWLEPASGAPQAPLGPGAGCDPRTAPAPRTGGAEGEAPVTVTLVSRAGGLARELRGPYHLAALEDPEAAVAAVTRAVGVGLRWPAEPWSPGRAVPFEPGLLAELERLADASPGPAAPAGPELAAAVERLLG